MLEEGAAAGRRGSAVHGTHERGALEAGDVVVGLRASRRRKCDPELGDALLRVYEPHEGGAAGRTDRGQKGGWQAAGEHGGAQTLLHAIFRGVGRGTLERG